MWKKVINRITLKKIIKYLLILGLAIMLIISALIGGFVLIYRQWSYENFSKTKFDSQIWKDAEKIFNPAPGRYSEDLNCIRGHMYDDLQKNYLKKGISKEELENLLGKTVTTRIYKSFFREKECIQYHLGLCSLGATDIMVVCLGKNNEVKEYFLSDVNDEGKMIIPYK